MQTDPTQQLINHLRRGGAYFMLWTPNGGETGDKKRSTWYAATDPVKAPSSWASKNVYFGVNPTTIRREYYQASTDETIAATNALYAEFDGKDFTTPTVDAIATLYNALRIDPANTQKTDKALWHEAIRDAQDAEFLTDPNHYKALATAHIARLTPAPSVVWDSGGGFQAVWLLAKTFQIYTDADRAHAKDIQARWVAWVGGDRGAHDLRRVLRLPGTQNRKKKYAPDYPIVSFVKTDFSQIYALDDLIALLPAPVVTDLPRPHPVSAKAQAGSHYTGDSVIDAYNAAHRIEDALSGQGYRRHGESYRDGQTIEYWAWSSKGSGASVEVFPKTNTSYHWSSRDPLHGRQTPFNIYCTHTHAGNVKEAVKAAAVMLGMVRTTMPTPTQTIMAARRWLQSANFAELVPQTLQSATGYRTNATDKRLYSAYLDILEGYGALRGPISNQQLSLASGLSEGTARNAQKRLISAGLIRRFETPKGSEGGAYFYELVFFDFVSCVDCAVLALPETIPYRAIYATETFTTYKAHDAFQRRGSKHQRQSATIKALGPDALLLIDVLRDFGPQSQQAIALRTHQSKYTISRIISRLEAHEVVSVKHEGRKRIASLNPEWLEVVIDLVPHMPTNGIAFNRNLSAAIRTADDCENKLAKKIGDPDRLEKQLERAANKVFAMIELEVEACFDNERQAEIMRRLTRHGATNRVAATSAADMQKDLATMDFVAFMRSEPTKPWLAKHDKGRLARMASTLAENEMLKDARRQMLYDDVQSKPAIDAVPIPNYHQMFLGGTV